MATGSSTTPPGGALTTAYFAPGTIVSPPSPSPGPLWEMPKNQNSPNSSTRATKPTWLSRARLPGAKTRSARSNFGPPSGVACPFVGVGRADTGGNPGSVGDKFAFGNTEERARLANMGCKQRGFRGQRAFDHTTGQGYVKSQRGHYHDGIFTKRNKFNMLLHETFGGGFSPPAVAKINRLARKAQRSGVDRTAYPPHSRLSFVSHHAERISIASVKGVNRAILDRRAKLASELSRRA